jgi:uncharacterized protein with PQ loop repeat
MHETAWVHAVTIFFAVTNAARIFAYLPQIARLVRSEGAAGVSVASWLVFASAHAGAVAYNIVVQHSATLALWAAGNLLASLTIALLATRNRVARTTAAPDRFYSTSFGGYASTASTAGRASMRPSSTP